MRGKKIDPVPAEWREEMKNMSTREKKLIEDYLRKIYDNEDKYFATIMTLTPKSLLELFYLQEKE